jgi:hypothetical protein
LYPEEEKVPADPEMGAAEIPHIIDHATSGGGVQCLLRLPRQTEQPCCHLKKKEAKESGGQVYHFAR